MYGTDRLPGPRSVPAYSTAAVLSWLALVLAALLVVVLAAGIVR